MKYLLKKWQWIVAGMIPVISAAIAAPSLFALTPPQLLLKAPKAQILDSQQVTEYDFDNKHNPIPGTGKAVMKYAYRTNTVVTPAISEKISERTNNAEFFDNVNGTKRVRLYAGTPFYKDTDNQWYQVDTATTTPSEFTKQTAGIFGGLLNTAHAAITSTFVGAGDGRIGVTAQASWAIARAASTATFAFPTDANGALQGEALGSFYLYRAFLPIDTSALPDNAVVASSTLYVWSNADCDGTETTNPASLTVVTTSQSSNTTFTTSEFSNFGTVKQSDTTVSIASIISAGSKYYAFPLNATGKSNVSVTGFTKLGLRPANDYSDATAPAARSYCTILFSETSGTTNDPYLDVDYTVPDNSSGQWFEVFN